MGPSARRFWLALVRSCQTRELFRKLVMKKHPSDRAIRIGAIVAVVALPLLYLIVALIYSAASAPFGRQVDPESAYAMNGLAWAVGYPMLKSDHPGTTTTMLAGTL